MQVQCSQILCKRARIPSLNFAETSEVAFGLGPGPFRKYANAFGVTTNVIVCFVQYETAVVYALYIASSLQQVREKRKVFNDAETFVALNDKVAFQSRYSLIDQQSVYK